MMVSKKESQTIRTFVYRQLRDEPDLSTLTIGILKRQYLEYVGHESLSSEAKHFMKQVVEEELIRMQDNDDDGSNSEAKVPQNKRKREEESGVGTESEDESRAKKSCRGLSSSSELEDEKESKTASDASEDDEQIKAGSGGTKKKTETQKQKTNKAAEGQISSDNSSDEETKEAQMDDEGLKENSGSPKEPRRKKENTVLKEKRKSSKTSEDESDSDSNSEKSAKRNNSESSDDDDNDDNENEGHVTVEKRDEDSDSSSLPSIEDDEEADKPKKEVKKKEKKTKKATKQENTKSEKGGTKTLARLKHYITLCGVRRNYKKLFENCRSIRSQVAALRKELEDLGVEGLPSIEKCKKIRMMRERAQEIADLDVNNIICSQGRSKRRSVLNELQKSSSPTYQRTLSSGSDSDQESKTHKRQRRTTDWRNLQGIISDDADSD